MPRSVKVTVEPRASGIEDGHMLEKLSDEFLRLGLVAVILLQCIGPRGEVVPAGAAGGLRVRRDHLDVSFTRSGQSLMPLGLPLRTRKTMVEV